MAALVIGASDARILFRHLLINAIGPIIVQITFLVPNAIGAEMLIPMKLKKASVKMAL